MADRADIGRRRQGQVTLGVGAPAGLEERLPFLTLALVALVIGLAPLIFPSALYYKIGGSMFITAIAAIGLNVLMGFAGQVSLGHAAFIGIGAYAVALLPKLGLHPLTSLIAAMAASGLIAWVIGRPMLRLKGYYLAIGTLAAGQLLSLVLVNERQITGGAEGITVGRLELFGFPVAGVVTWYWVSGALMLLGGLLVVNLDRSPTGRALRAVRGSEISAAIAGIDVARMKLRAFVISAVYASLAGSLLAFSNGVIRPEAAGFLHSVELVAMVVLGGIGSVVGSIFGTLLLKALPQLLPGLHDAEQVVLGLVMILVMIFLPSGIVPALVRLVRQGTSK